MPHVSPLNRYCWNYHIPGGDTVTMPLAKELLTFHIHLAAVEDLDVFSVATIRGGVRGMWDLVESIARASETTASKLMDQKKRDLRAQFKLEVNSGLFVPVDQRCSPRRVEATFNHIMFNQGVRIYDQERDGFPQF